MLRESFAQLVSRGCFYAVTLLILPSYLTISTPGQFATIVFIATLAGVSAQLDGGYATALLTYLAAKRRPTRTLVISAIQYCTYKSFLYAIAASLVFALCWGAQDLMTLGVGNFGELCLVGVGIAVATTLNNVLIKCFFIHPVNKISYLGIFFGGFITLLMMLSLRAFHNNSPLPIVAAFLVGATVTLLCAIFEVRKFPLLDGGSSELFSFSDLGAARWLFYVQTANIILNLKNALIVKTFIGTAALASFTVFSAIYAIMFACSSLFQTQLIVKIGGISSNVNATKDAIAKVVLKTLAYMLTLLVVIASSFWFGKSFFFNHMFASANIAFTALQYSLLVCCALMSTLALVAGCYLIARNLYYQLFVYSLVVLCVDLAVQFWLLDILKESVSFMSLSVANVVFLCLLYLKHKRQLI